MNSATEDLTQGQRIGDYAMTRRAVRIPAAKSQMQIRHRVAGVKRIPTRIQRRADRSDLHPMRIRRRVARLAPCPARIRRNHANGSGSSGHVI